MYKEVVASVEKRIRETLQSNDFSSADRGHALGELHELNVLRFADRPYASDHTEDFSLDPALFGMGMAAPLLIPYQLACIITEPLDDAPLVAI